jgi:thioredoxin-disulfide reductase
MTMLDTVIIGAGIAGLTAAIYASRKRMKFEIISSAFGGQFMESGEVLNYPGITKTTGGEFASTMREQMKFNNVKVKPESVKEIKKAGENFKIITGKNEYETRSVIIASGASPRELGVPGEKEYKNKGLTYCAICDGPLFRGADVAVIGAGNSALEAVDFLLNIAKKIYLINNKDKFTAHEYLVERITNQKKVKIITNAVTKEILGDKKNVSSLKYEQAGEEKELKVEGIFVEIGRVPNTDFAKNILELDEHKHIVMDCQAKTSVPGIFAAGDCASGHEYQYVIAAGQGCMALIKAARYLASKKE